MVITPYEASMAAEWDEFAARSRQQTFLLTRPYMDYHSDRFADASIIARSDSGRIVAMLPANRSGNILWSHQGLTYGGWITPVRGFDASSMLEVWALAIEYYRNNGVEEMLYKPLPWIYPSVPADDDLYALFRLGATMEACGVSSAVDLRDAPRFDENSRRNLRRAEVAGLRVGENRRFAEYWKILEDVLAGRHDTRPVHSLAEIELLASRFPENIRLFAVDGPDGRMVAGTVLYLTPTVAHAQYIAASDEGRAHGALALLFHELRADLAAGLYGAVRYLDFGISTERGGRILNEGLHRQKQGFGGRSVAYPLYRLPLRRTGGNISQNIW